MHTSTNESGLLRLVGLLGVLFGLAGCPDGGKRPINATCALDADCDSGFCLDGVCLDPKADPDQDGLVNSVERSLGTNAFNADTDGDGADDLSEVGGISAPVDSDDDGVIDALEATTEDADGDCLADQFDATDADITAAKVLVVCNQVGVCAADLAGLTARCAPPAVAGSEPVWTCVYDGVDGYEGGSDAGCDGEDNDCDGQTDEGYAPVATTCGEAACTGTGATFCEGGVVKDSCTEEPAADDATCNGVDDDCDSVTDEDWLDVPSTCGRGACAATGVMSCAEGGLQDTCTPGTPAASDTTCDNRDENCDGQTDEGYAAHATTCGRGACARAGVTSCAGGSEQDSCVPGTAAVGDATCDGADDDCDGQTDEDYAPVATSCGTGACAGSGVTSCVAGEELDSCATSGGAPLDAHCDRVDDDCDGSTDEDYVAVVTHCGDGACERSGMTSCTTTGLQDSCTPGTAAASDATCNDVDDDCNGQTDEGYVEAATTCGMGPCLARGTLRCVGGVPTDSCTPGTPALSDATCNDVDDDCNGQTDEDYVPAVTSCGEGLCVAPGLSFCEGGAVESDCTPLAPDCGTAECGSDGCGGTCGACPPPSAACLQAGCAAGQCGETVAAGSCFIDGVCYAERAANPANPCLVCRTSASTTGWSKQAAGASCPDDGETCTTDTCDGEGACQHSVRADFASCLDGSARTVLDMCFAGRCGGFEERVEPLAGTTSERYMVVSPGYGSGLNGLSTQSNAAGQSTLGVTTFTTALQALGTPIGSYNFSNRTAVSEDLALNGNTLYELVDGQWTSAPDAGSLRLAWPSPAGAAPPPTFDRIARFAPAPGTTRYVYGVGVTTTTPLALVVRRCAETSACVPPNCSWSCANMATSAVATDFGANIAFFQGNPVIGSNLGGQVNPTQIRVLRYNATAQAWYADTALSQAASGRGLRDFARVGGGALPGSPPELLVGAGSGGLLYVTDLVAVSPITVAGAPPLVSYRQIASFRGYVVVLGSYAVNDSVYYGIAYARLDGALDKSASWSWRLLFTPTDARSPVGIVGDAGNLFLAGGVTVPPSTTEQRALWRFALPTGTSTLRERFDGPNLPPGWSLVTQGQATNAPNWHIVDGALAEDSNTHDVNADASVIEKRGTFLKSPTPLRFGDGTLRVDVRATDDDSYGLMWGVQSSLSYFRVSFDRQRGFARVARVDNDAFTVLAENLAFAPPVNLWHRIEIERNGPAQTVRLNGSTLFTFSDARYPLGQVALYAWGMQDVYFDDLTIIGP